MIECIDNPKPVSYEFYGGKNILILPRLKGLRLCDECPFCGFHHTHGLAEGHRAAHCPDIIVRNGRKRRVIKKDTLAAVAPDSTFLYCKDGYIIKHYERNGK